MVEQEKMTALVLALQNGEDDAATELYQTFQGDIYYYILKIVKDPHLAEDLTQDTFLEILETIGKLREPAAFVTWSRQIAYHRCTAHFRKRQELLADEDGDGYSVFDTIEEDRTEFIPDEAMDQAELRKAVQAMVDALPEEQRSAIMMRYFEELSVQDIAKIQKVSQGTVKSRLNYGRKAIAKSVEDYEKKSGVKLRCTGVVPLMLWLFRELRIAQGLSLTGKAAAGGSAVAGTAAAAAGGAAAKIIAGVTAAALVLGGVVAAVLPKSAGEEKLDSWYGYGKDSVGGHTLRFEMNVDTMTDTQISGHLQVTKLYEVTHDSDFEGQGTVMEDGTVQYAITYEVPAVIGVIPTFEYPEMALLYNRETEVFSIKRRYYVDMEREVANPPQTVLAENTAWSGKADCGFCWPRCKGDHQVTFQVEKMTDTTISGRFTEHGDTGEPKYTSEFTGRGYSTEDTIYYEVAMANPRSEKVGVINVCFDYFWLRYDKAADTLWIPSHRLYEGTFTRDAE